MRNVLITGAASGIGGAVKDVFLENGYSVYAIDINGINERENLKSFTANICSAEQLNGIKKYLLDSGVVLDIIVNVAGVHAMASLVETNFDKIKNVIDVNLCGTMLVNSVFYPALSPNGRIVIVTSEVANLDPMPFNGAYNISKTALECYAQALRQELNLVGQKVVTIRPGAVKTPLCDNSISDTQALASSTTLYKKQAGKFAAVASKFMGTPADARKTAALIYRASAKKHPKLTYKNHRNMGLVLMNLLPKRLQCAIIKTILK